MNPTAMSGIFDTPKTGFMPVGSPMGPQPGHQSTNSMMPMGNPMGQSPMQPQSHMQPPAPMTQAQFTPRASIAQPNNNFMMDALQNGMQAPQSTVQQPGTPMSNTPGINMQSTPGFSNMQRSGTASDPNSMMMQQLK